MAKKAAPPVEPVSRLDLMHKLIWPAIGTLVAIAGLSYAIYSKSAESLAQLENAKLRQELRQAEQRVRDVEMQSEENVKQADENAQWLRLAFCTFFVASAHR